MPDIKAQPNHRRYLEALARMTPGERFRRAFELGEVTRKLFRHGLRKRFPNVSEEEIQRLYAKRLLECSNNNY